MRYNNLSMLPNISYTIYLSSYLLHIQHYSQTCLLHTICHTSSTTTSSDIYNPSYRHYLLSGPVAHCTLQHLVMCSQSVCPLQEKLERIIFIFTVIKESNYSIKSKDKCSIVKLGDICLYLKMDYGSSMKRGKALNMQYRNKKSKLT